MPGFSRSDTSMVAEWWRTVDKSILMAAMTLMAVGLVLTLATGHEAALEIGASPYHYAIRQAVFVSAALVVLTGASMMSPAWVRRIAAAVFIVAFLLMAGVLMFGHEAKGAQRWIRLAGFSLQPSELVKPAVIVLTGWLLSQRDRYPGVPWTLLAFSFFAATLGLLLLQPDVGQSALLTAGFCITFFVAGMSLAWAVSLTLGGVGLGAGLFALFPHVRYRVLSFFDPEAHDTYQVDLARQALERGGLLGAGIGEGRIKQDLPDAHNDFIYAVVGEEYGFIMCFALILGFAAVTMRGMSAASDHPDGFRRAAGSGLFAMFGLQAAINIGVNVSLIPNKGMTLPFVSAGGSSMIGAALTVGLALALTRRRPDVSMRPRIAS